MNRPAYQLSVVLILVTGGTLFLPPQVHARQEQQLIDLIRQANDELLNKGNLDFADEVFAATYGDRGPEGIKAFVTELRSAFPDLHVTVGEFVVEGDRVAWVRTHRGTHQGEYMGVPATGKTITWRAIIISRYLDNKIVEETGISDLLEHLE